MNDRTFRTILLCMLFFLAGYASNMPALRRPSPLGFRFGGPWDVVRRATLPPPKLTFIDDGSNNLTVIPLPAATPWPHVHADRIAGVTSGGFYLVDHGIVPPLGFVPTPIFEDQGTNAIYIP